MVPRCSSPADRDPTLFPPAQAECRHFETGDEPMTTAQRSYLETLTRESGEHLDPNPGMTKAEAALRIRRAATDNRSRDQPTGLIDPGPLAGHCEPT